jgi:2',3'-cyclic-nucleotide 2'-phosphodiesterase
MRLLFLGDIVGTPGVELVKSLVPRWRAVEAFDFVVANGENASNGSGISPSLYRQLRGHGIDAVTLGDHIYKKFDIANVLNNPCEPVVKPANYPPDAPGRDHVIVRVRTDSLAVVSLMGRTYMKPVDCPFAAIDRVLLQLGDVKCVLVDFHAEATADKYQMLHHLDGRVSAIVGTHTHVPTADEHVSTHGTAFICDVGMCGPHAGVLGRRADRVLETVRTFAPTSFDVATEDVRLNGVVIEIDSATGRATRIERVVKRANAASN